MSAIWVGRACLGVLVYNVLKEARITAVIEFIDMSLKAEGYAAGQVWAR